MYVEVGFVVGKFFEFGVGEGCVDGGGAGGVGRLVGVFIYTVRPIWVEIGGLDAVPCDFEVGEEVSGFVAGEGEFFSCSGGDVVCLAFYGSSVDCGCDVGCGELGVGGGVGVGLVCRFL